MQENSKSTTDYVQLAQKYFESIIFSLIIFILILFSGMFTEVNPIYLMYSILLLIFFLIDFTRNYRNGQLLLKLFRISSQETLQLLNIFLKLLIFLFIGGLLIIYPPGAPISFLIPFAFSLDYYFILAFWWTSSTVFYVYKLLFS